MDNLLVVQDLRVTYGGVTAVGVYLGVSTRNTRSWRARVL
jgi:hypothetical protein